MFEEKKKPKRRKKAKQGFLPVPESVPKENPLDNAEYTGDTEKDDKTEIGVIKDTLEEADKEAQKTESKKLKEYKDAVKQQKSQTARLNGQGFYSILIFEDEESCYKFLEHIGYPTDEEGAVIQHQEPGSRGAFINGTAVAKMLGVDLEVSPLKFKQGKPDKRLIEELGVFDKDVDG